MRSYEHRSQSSSDPKKWPVKEKSVVTKSEGFCWTLTYFQRNFIKTGLPP